MITAAVRTSPPTMSQMSRSGYTGAMVVALNVRTEVITVFGYRMPSQLGLHEAPILTPVNIWQSSLCHRREWRQRW